jgi:adenylate cyclase
MLRLAIFGRFRAADALGNEIPIKSRKSRALLAYLALPPGKERSREAIMALLWSDRGDEQARSSLRQALSGLRKDLGETAIATLRITDESLELDPDHVMVEPASPGEVLLDGLRINDPAFEEWLRDERLRNEDAAVPDAHPPEPPLFDKPSIAVLPFVNMSGDPEQEYFSDGITEDIITELSRFHELLVIARNSSFAYKGRSVNVTEIGRELGVHYIVEGSVRKAGNRVRVTAQLTDSRSGAHLWAERYDRDLEDIFAVQDELAQAIVTMLPIQLQSSMLETIRAKPTENLSAYEYLLRGRWLWHGDVTNARDALAMFERAVALDPNCGRAYAIAAFVYAHAQFSLGIDFDEAARNSRFNAQKALSVDDNDAFIHAAAALAFMICGDHDLGEKHAERALKLNANEVWVTYACGLVFTYAGRLEEGLEWLHRAVLCDPRVADNWHESLVECHYMRHDYKMALETFRSWQNIPFYMYDIYAACYAQLGDAENARRMYETYWRLAPEGHDSAKDHQAHIRMMKRQVDRDHWIEGYVRAGFDS